MRVRRTLTEFAVQTGSQAAMGGNDNPWLPYGLATFGYESVAAAVETSQVRRPLRKPVLENFEVPAQAVGWPLEGSCASVLLDYLSQFEELFYKCNAFRSHVP